MCVLCVSVCLSEAAEGGRARVTASGLEFAYVNRRRLSSCDYRDRNGVESGDRSPLLGLVLGQVLCCAINTEHVDAKWSFSANTI